jgi:hypothetical protein
MMRFVVDGSRLYDDFAPIFLLIMYLDIPAISFPCSVCFFCLLFAAFAFCFLLAFAVFAFCAPRCDRCDWCVLRAFYSIHVCTKTKLNDLAAINSRPERSTYLLVSVSIIHICSTTHFPPCQPIFWVPLLPLAPQ